jgi:hypothetical protein
MSCVRVQVAPALDELVEGEAPMDTYYFCDGLQKEGKFLKQTQAEWLEMQDRWLVESVDVVDIPDDEATAERMKHILRNCHDRLSCKWSRLKCTRPFEGAAGGISIYSCAYNQTVVKVALCHLLVPSNKKFEDALTFYPDWLEFDADISGRILSKEEVCDEDLPM